MTSPIPQAAIDAVAATLDPAAFDLDTTFIGRSSFLETADEARNRFQTVAKSRAKAALEAALPHIWAHIDVGELAEVIADHDSLEYVADTGIECECSELVAGPDDDRPYQNWRLHTARAVIAHLAGKGTK